MNGMTRKVLTSPRFGPDSTFCLWVLYLSKMTRGESLRVAQLGGDPSDGTGEHAAPQRGCVFVWPSCDCC